MSARWTSNEEHWAVLSGWHSAERELSFDWDEVHEVLRHGARYVLYGAETSSSHRFPTGTNWLQMLMVSWHDGTYSRDRCTVLILNEDGLPSTLPHWCLGLLMVTFPRRYCHIATPLTHWIKFSEKPRKGMITSFIAPQTRDAKPLPRVTSHLDWQNNNVGAIRRMSNIPVSDRQSICADAWTNQEICDITTYITQTVNWQDWLNVKKFLLGASYRVLEPSDYEHYSSDYALTGLLL